MIRQYLFRTQVSSDWTVGSPITYSGSWQGKNYVDKGVIVDIRPEELLHTTYLSGLSGKEDLPENYAHVIYRLHAVDPQATHLTLEQDNIETEQGVQHLKENWSLVLDQLKKVVEQTPAP